LRRLQKKLFGKLVPNLFVVKNVVKKEDCFSYKTLKPMFKEKTVSEAIHYRRSIRVYDAEKSIDKNIVKNALNKLL
jgi:hypothetical protein